MLKRHKREIEVIIALEKFETQNDGKLFSKLCQISCPFQLSRLLVRRWGTEAESSLGPSRTMEFSVSHFEVDSFSLTRLELTRESRMSARFPKGSESPREFSQEFELIPPKFNEYYEYVLCASD